ncbi:MAG: putative acetyltransferase [Chthoniobacter sp.]|jgi:putative acetyltransferase|nr:putative acetyltransferase [Chthoniobacter sp.]
MQRVFLVPHDPGWAEAFARESLSIAETIGDVLVTVHHIGSTAIPGIHAKPIIDMLAVVRDLSLLDERSPRLEALGYEARGEFGIAGRRYFRKGDRARTHQIHAFAIGSPQIERHLAFRDFMRAHPVHARQYDALKRRLAEMHPDDIASYTDGKDGFIAEMDAKAAAWRVAGALDIRIDDLHGPEIAALLTEHLEDMAKVSPPESRHALNLDGLRQPDITFWSVWQGSDLVGCGALKELDATHGEIKSMRVSRAHLRRGIATRVLDHLIGEAKRRGYRRLSLETGSMAFFEPAHRLYAKAGFRLCAPFASYVEDPNSTFMSMEL